MGSGVVGMLAALMVAAAPVNGGALSVSQITVNDQLGDQFDPHVDGNLAAYSSVSLIGFDQYEQIHYFDFGANLDAIIPNLLPDGGLARDLLSDVDSNRVVFTRIFGDRNGIMLFDRATSSITELAPAPSSQRLGVALGGNAVAFIDYGFTSNGSGELMVLDLPGSTPVRLTNDLAIDDSPAVSNDGSTITWSHCESFANCDIWVARRTGSTWAVSALAATLAQESDPDSNGTLVAFQREDPTTFETDLVIVPAAGGAENVIPLVGNQRHPSIRGDLVAFEHRVDPIGLSDIALIELSTNRLFLLTNTPSINETLNDVTVLPDGRVRVVWQASDLNDSPNNNVYGATFTLPSPPICSTGTKTLEASRTYANPNCDHDDDDHRGTQWTDATVAVNATITVPASLPVTAGNAGNGFATLTFATTNGNIVCKYRGGANQMHPTSPAQVAAGLNYLFDRCEGVTLHAGDPLAVSTVSLHVQIGDSRRPVTTVRVALATTTCVNPLPPLIAPRPHHHYEGHHDDDDEFATLSNELVDGTSGPNAGCSSSGATLPLFMLLGLALLLMRRQPAAIRLVARSERRKLRR